MAIKHSRLRTALLLVEGETEEEFYHRFVNHYNSGAPRHVKNLRGNFNINTKIADAAIAYISRHNDRLVDVYVCIDQERLGVPAFNRAKVTSELQRLPNFRSLIPVVAILTIESLFFLDIDGIYKFLRAQRSKRKPHLFSNYRSFTHRDLEQLFARFDRVYYKGSRCKGFVTALDLDKLVRAEELSRLKKALAGYA